MQTLDDTAGMSWQELAEYATLLLEMAREKGRVALRLTRWMEDNAPAGRDRMTQEDAATAAGRRPRRRAGRSPRRDGPQRHPSGSSTSKRSSAPSNRASRSWRQTVGSSAKLKLPQILLVEQPKVGTGVGEPVDETLVLGDVLEDPGHQLPFELSPLVRVHPPRVAAVRASTTANGRIACAASIRSDSLSGRQAPTRGITRTG
jgi:hypothetical protein